MPNFLGWFHMIADRTRWFSPAPKEVNERCVSCHAETQISREWPIDGRAYYIEGAGQLCRSCYTILYPVPTPTNYDE